MGTITIHPTAGIKMPIKGVQFSNIEFSLTIDKEVVEDENLDNIYDTLSELMEMVVKEYHGRLSDMIESASEEVSNTARLEIEKEYKDKIELAKTEIIKLRKILTDNGLSYK